MDDDEQFYIINLFGLNNQQRKLQEEVFELQEAITLNDKCHILEELADVMNLLQQIQKYYKFDDDEIQHVIDYKIERTMDRIKNEYYIK